MPCCIVLCTPIKLALLDKAGIQAEIYQHVLQYDKCNRDELNNLNVNADEYTQTYLNTVNWPDQSINALLKV